MPIRKKPPLDFWLWLAVIGLVVIVGAVSVQFPAHIAQPVPSAAGQGKGR
jgi:hypothetical protein